MVDTGSTSSNARPSKTNGKYIKSITAYCLNLMFFRIDMVDPGSLSPRQVFDTGYLVVETS